LGGGYHIAALEFSRRAGFHHDADEERGLPEGPLTPVQLEYFYSTPFGAVAAWGIATWGGVVGSLLLLFRKGLAVHVFAVSIVAMPLTTVYSFVLSDGMKVMGGGAGMVIFNAVIFVVGVLLLLYARAVRRRGVLR
jgi:hypothetical protein